MKKIASHIAERAHELVDEARELLEVAAFLGDVAVREVVRVVGGRHDGQVDPERRDDHPARDAGDGGFTVEMTDLYQRQVKEQTVQEAIRTLERRVNALGVAEPVIAATGNRGDQIIVQPDTQPRSARGMLAPARAAAFSGPTSARIGAQPGPNGRTFL